MSLNKAMLIGRLGENPTDSLTQDNTTVTNFNIATNESWTDKDGSKKERTEWHRIVVWGNLAKVCKEHLSKGKQVYIEGKIQTRSWEGEGNRQMYTTEIVASAVQFLDGITKNG